MSGVDDHTEYNGGGVQDNTLYPKDIEAFTIAERLRLQSITGQDENPFAKPDPAFWHGAVVEDVNAIRRRERAEASKQRRIRASEAKRYRRTR